RLEHPFEGTSLTRTERRIARLILEEKRPDAIVRELTLRPVTLRWHVSNIYAKLGVDSQEGIRAWVDRGAAPTLPVAGGTCSTPARAGCRRSVCRALAGRRLQRRLLE